MSERGANISISRGAETGGIAATSRGAEGSKVTVKGASATSAVRAEGSNQINTYGGREIRPSIISSKETNSSAGKNIIAKQVVKDAIPGIVDRANDAAFAKLFPNAVPLSSEAQQQFAIEQKAALTEVIKNTIDSNASRQTATVDAKTKDTIPPQLGETAPYGPNIDHIGRDKQTTLTANDIQDLIATEQRKAPQVITKEIIKAEKVADTETNITGQEKNFSEKKNTHVKSVDKTTDQRIASEEKTVINAEVRPQQNENTPTHIPSRWDNTSTLKEEATPLQEKRAPVSEPEVANVKNETQQFEQDAGKIAAITEQIGALQQEKSSQDYESALLAKIVAGAKINEADLPQTEEDIATDAELETQERQRQVNLTHAAVWVEELEKRQKKRKRLQIELTSTQSDAKADTKVHAASPKQQAIKAFFSLAPTIKKAKDTLNNLKTKFIVDKQAQQARAALIEKAVAKAKTDQDGFVQGKEVANNLGNNPPENAISTILRIHGIQGQRNTDDGSYHAVFRKIATMGEERKRFVMSHVLNWMQDTPAVTVGSGVAVSEQQVNVVLHGDPQTEI